MYLPNTRTFLECGRKEGKNIFFFNPSQKQSVVQFLTLHYQMDTKINMYIGTGTVIY